MGKSGHNLFLVGMMGAGKTTVGRLLARRLRCRFIDSDHEIERRCGVRIPVIFDIEGEAGFRQRESQVIAALNPAISAAQIEGIALSERTYADVNQVTAEIPDEHDFVEHSVLLV